MGGDYGAGYEVRRINRRIMEMLGNLSVFTLSIRTAAYAGKSSGASSSSTRFIMVTDGLRSEAILSMSKSTNLRACSAGGAGRVQQLDREGVGVRASA